MTGQLREKRVHLVSTIQNLPMGWRGLGLRSAKEILCPCLHWICPLTPEPGVGWGGGHSIVLSVPPELDSQSGLLVVY